LPAGREGSGVQSNEPEFGASDVMVSRVARFVSVPFLSTKVMVPCVVGSQRIVAFLPAVRTVPAVGKVIGFSLLSVIAETTEVKAARAERATVKKRMAN